MSPAIQVLLPYCLVCSPFGLVLQQKKQKPSGYWKLMSHDNNSRQYPPPIAFLDAVKKVQTTTNAFHSSRVPTVTATLPSEEFYKENNNPAWSSEKPISSTSAPAAVEKCPLSFEGTQPKKSPQNTHDIFASPSKARKFHLIRSPSSMLSPYLAPKTIAQKHRNRRKKDLAVFAENPEILRRAKLSGDAFRHDSAEPRDIDIGNGKDTLRLEQPRKKPNATAAERKWRTETWAKPPKTNAFNGNLTRTAESINEPSNQWNYESTRLAEQLQEVALEEIHTGDERAKGLSGSGQLKIKPKPPKPRQLWTESLDVVGSGKDLTMNAVNLDNDGDYVLDTYVRSSAQPADTYYDSLHDIDRSNIGILIIEDEEEEGFWEDFAEDRQSDPEWNSEEEDENGLSTNI